MLRAERGNNGNILQHLYLSSHLLGYLVYVYSLDISIHRGCIMMLRYRPEHMAVVQKTIDEKEDHPVAKVVVNRRARQHLICLLNRCSTVPTYTMPSSTATKVLQQRLKHPIPPHTLALVKSQLKVILDTYLHHRPFVQRALTAGFVLYCLGTTWLGVTGRAKSGTARTATNKRSKGTTKLFIAVYGEKNTDG